MIASPAPAMTSGTNDSAFNGLIDELTARLQAGEKIDIDAYTSDHPEHADALRRLLPALQVLADLSSSREANGAAPLDLDASDNGKLGDFRLIREVGRGGMGVVYEAEQISLCRRVALKVLPFAATMDPRALQRFRHEAQAAAMLHHNNIVPVYGVGCDRSVHYYAMQLIEGRSLGQIIDDRRAVHVNAPVTPQANETIGYVQDNRDAHASGSPETAPIAALTSQRDRAHYRRVAELIAQAADALEYAHAMGVVHRDIKPANLILDAAGHLWVTDFGLAKLDSAAGMTVSGDLVGTLRYMSPEQALARHGLVDHRTDVYSLGATLYELLTLRPLIDAEEKAEILRRIAFEEPTTPRKIDKAIPVELETVTLKALAKNPNERYATAGEFAEDLRRWLGNQTIRAKPPSLGQRAAKWARRNAAAAWATTAVLMLGVVGLSVSMAVLAHKESETLGAFKKANAQRNWALANMKNATEVLDRVYLRAIQDRGNKAVTWQNASDAKLDSVTNERELKDVLAYYEKFIGENADEPDAQLWAAEGHWRIAEVRKKLDMEWWREEREQAIALAGKLANQNPANPQFRLVLASYLTQAGRAEEAAPLWERLVAEAGDKDARVVEGALHNYRALARSLESRGRLADADRAWQQMTSLVERHLRWRVDQRQGQHTLAGALSLAADLRRDHGLALAGRRTLEPHPARDASLAVQATEFRKAIASLDQIASVPRESRNDKVDADFAIIVCSGYLAQTLRRMNDLEGADRVLERAVTIAEKLVKENPDWPQRRRNLQALLIRRAEVLRALGQAPAAQAALDEARRQAAEFRPTAEKEEYTGLWLFYAEFLTRPGRDGVPDEEVRGAIKNAGRLARQPAQTEDLAFYLTRGFDPRFHDYPRTIELCGKVLERMPANGFSHSLLAEALLRVGRPAEAITAGERAAKINAESGPAWDWFTLAMAHSQLGDVYHAGLYYAAAARAMDANNPLNERLGRYRAEAADRLGVRSDPGIPSQPGSRIDSP